METRLQPVASEENTEEVDKSGSGKSSRKRKFDTYDPEEKNKVDEDSDIEEVDDQSDDEPVVPTSNASSVKNRFSVSCGNKKGILDQEKLARGEDCIEREGCWFAPSAFEQFGGRGSRKKWKATILYNNKPLQFWFDQGILSSPQSKGRLSKASASLDHKESHPKGTVIQSAAEHEDMNEHGHEDPSETEEDKAAVQKEGTSETNTCFDNGVLQKNAKVVIKRLPRHIQGRLHVQSNGVVPQENGCCLKSKDEDVQNKKGKKHTDSSSAAERLKKDTSERIKKKNKEMKISSVEDSEMDVTEHLSPPADISRDISGLDAAQQLIKRRPQADSPRPIMAGPAPTPLTSPKLETMEFEQLKREKIKMQLKVLKLQEEYYTLQLQKMKQ